MESKICLDTDFLVDLLRNRKEEVEFVKSAEETSALATTFINLFELYYGAYKSYDKERNLKAVNLLLNKLEVLNLSIESVKMAGEFLAMLERHGKPIDFRDLLIGCIAAANNYSIKTRNVKDFKLIEGLSIA